MEDTTLHGRPQTIRKKDERERTEKTDDKEGQKKLMTGMKDGTFDLRTEDRRHGKQKLRQADDDDPAEIRRLGRNQIRQHGGQTTGITNDDNT